MALAAYIRVSTPEQAEQEEVSLSEQEAGIRAWAARSGKVIDRVYSDPGYTGTNGNRPAFKALLAAIENGVHDGIVVWKASRLFRSGLLAYRVKEALDAVGADIFSVTDGLNSQTLGFYALVGEMERENMLSQTAMGRLGRLKRGKWLGGTPPMGYAPLPSGELGVHEEHAEVIRLIFRLAAEGWSQRAIAKHLAEHAYPTVRGGRWHQSTVGRILQNEMYATGKFRIVCQTGPRDVSPPVFLEVPPLITQEVWDAAQAARHQRPVRTNHLRPRTRQALLRGRLTCGCGCGTVFSPAGKMYRAKRLGGTYGPPTSRLYYASYNRTREKVHWVCKNANWLRADILDSLVWQRVLMALRDPDALREYLAAYALRGAEERESVATELRRMRDLVAQLTRKRTAMAAALMDADNPIHALYSADDLREQAARLAHQLREAEVEAGRLERTLASYPSGDLGQMMEQVQAALASALDDERLAGLPDDGWEDDIPVEFDLETMSADWDFQVVDLPPEFSLAGAVGLDDLLEARRQVLERLDLRGVVMLDGSVEFTGAVPIGRIDVTEVRAKSGAIVLSDAPDVGQPRIGMSFVIPAESIRVRF